MITLAPLYLKRFFTQPDKHSDFRGSFTSYNKIDFEETIKQQIHFCKTTYFFKKGVLRGLHYQLPPHGQSKLVTVLVGRVLDVVVDVREGSPTFGQHFSQELSAENGLQLFIPRGFAHGYITLSENSLFLYKVDQYYYPEYEGNIAPDDPELAINWRLSKSEWTVSEKDQNHPSLSNAKLFDYKQDLYA